MHFRRIGMLLVVSMLFSSFAGVGFAEENRQELNLGFKDSEEAEWASESIGKMKSKNVLSGYEDGRFRPNQPVSRVEAVVTAVRLMGLEEEAKAKASDARLHFTDAAAIDHWAKGYIIVALEQGLFDTSESALQPNRPASRVWVAGLLVKALGLEQEALRQMTAVPDFADAGDIAAGAIGYVNVAVAEGIVSGYPDETFKPNNHVTRAEMATLLVRTNDNLLEQSGAVTVTGTITDIDFESSVTGDVYSGEYGSISIQSFNEDSFTFVISPELAVPFHNRFIPASELQVGDAVSLKVEDEVVVEAAFINKEQINETTAGIHEFQMDIELMEDHELKLKYKNKHGRIQAEFEQKMDDEKEKVKGERAVEIAEEFLAEAALTPYMSEEEIIQHVFAALGLEEYDFEEMEIEIKFSNGTTVEIKIEDADIEVEREEEQPESELNAGGIIKFDLEAKLVNKKKVKIEYEYDDGDIEAKFQANKERYSGEQAVLAVEELFSAMNVSEDMNEDEILERLLIVMEAEELEASITFASGKEISIEFDQKDFNDDDDEDEEDDD